MKYVIVIFLAFSCTATTSHIPKPIKKGPNYTIYRQSDYIKEERHHITERVEQSSGSGISARTWVEIPSNDTVPNDYGGNYGDVIFRTTKKDGYLLGRDTIVNNYYPYNIIIAYEQSYDGLYVKDFKLLNFGRERGNVWLANIFHNGGAVEAEIQVAAGHQVRILAEAYGDYDD